MKYSVVIPMYNSMDTIERTINSVVNQTMYSLIDEIIIVDDGSTDDSLAIVKEKAKGNCKIVIIRKKNGGAASARNEGIRQAHNDMIALLDSDDIWINNKIEIQNRILENNPTIKAIGSNRVGESIHLGSEIRSGIRKVSPLQYCIKCWPCTPSIIFDRTVFKDDLFFPEDMTHAEEGLFFLRLANDAGLYYCKEELVFCGDGKKAFGSSGLSGNIGKMHKGVKMMIKSATEKKYISRFALPALLLYEDLKYIRRKIVVNNYSK